MRKPKMNNETKTFNLNECVTMKICYDRTEAPIAIKRSIRPFIKAINKALNETSEKYNQIAKDYLGAKDPKSLTEEEAKAFSNHMNVNIFKINSEIYPAIDLARPSTANFFIRFWTPFAFKLEVDGEYNLKLADDIDEKVVELYPELEMSLDKEDEKVSEDIATKSDIKNNAKKSDSK